MKNAKRKGTYIWVHVKLWHRIKFLFLAHLHMSLIYKGGKIKLEGFTVGPKKLKVNDG